MRGSLFQESPGQADPPGGCADEGGTRIRAAEPEAAPGAPTSDQLRKSSGYDPSVRLVPSDESVPAAGVERKEVGPMRVNVLQYTAFHGSPNARSETLISKRGLVCRSGVRNGGFAGL